MGTGIYWTKTLQYVSTASSCTSPLYIKLMKKSPRPLWKCSFCAFATCQSISSENYVYALFCLILTRKTEIVKCQISWHLLLCPTSSFLFFPPNFSLLLPYSSTVTRPVSGVSRNSKKSQKRSSGRAQWQDDYPFHHNCEVLTWADSSPQKAWGMWRGGGRRQQSDRKDASTRMQTLLKLQWDKRKDSEAKRCLDLYVNAAMTT